MLYSLNVSFPDGSFISVSAVVDLFYGIRFFSNIMQSSVVTVFTEA